MRCLCFNRACKPGLTDDSADGRTRQGSSPTIENLSPLPRSGTLASLPPYSSSEPNYSQTESSHHAKTPAELLGLGISHTRKTSETVMLDFHLSPASSDGKRIYASPQDSPNTLRLSKEQDERSELDSKEAMKSLDRRWNAIDEVAISPSGLGVSVPFSEGSSAASQVFTSPTISSRRTSTTEATNSTSGRDSIFALDCALVEKTMANLNGVQVSYYKAKSRILYPVSSIEAFRNKQTGRRYIIVSPPASSNVKLYFGTSKFLRPNSVLEHGPCANDFLP